MLKITAIRNKKAKTSKGWFNRRKNSQHSFMRKYCLSMKIKFILIEIWTTADLNDWFGNNLEYMSSNIKLIYIYFSEYATPRAYLLFSSSFSEGHKQKILIIYLFLFFSLFILKISLCSHWMINISFMNLFYFFLLPETLRDFLLQVRCIDIR